MAYQSMSANELHTVWVLSLSSWHKSSWLPCHNYWSIKSRKEPIKLIRWYMFSVYHWWPNLLEINYHPSLSKLSLCWPNWCKQSILISPMTSITNFQRHAWPLSNRLSISAPVNLRNLLMICLRCPCRCPRTILTIFMRMGTTRWKLMKEMKAGVLTSMMITRMRSRMTTTPHGRLDVALTVL